MALCKINIFDLIVVFLMNKGCLSSESIILL